MKKTNTALLVLIAILFVSVLYLLYLNFSKIPIATTSTPQTGTIPTENLTPTAVSTNNWKTYTNDFGGFSLLYPPNLEVNEKNISAKEKQTDFNSQLGNKFNISIADSGVNPGWGGGCGPDDMGKVNLLGELKSTCINNESLWAFYFSNTNNSKEFSLSATFGEDLTKEDVLKILSTFKFTESASTSLGNWTKRPNGDFQTNCLWINTAKAVDNGNLEQYVKNYYQTTSLDSFLNPIKYTVKNRETITISAQGIGELFTVYFSKDDKKYSITFSVASQDDITKTAKCQSYKDDINFVLNNPDLFL